MISKANATYYQMKSAIYADAGGWPGMLWFNTHHLRCESHQAGIVVLYPSVGSEEWSPLKITHASVLGVLEAVNGRWYPETDEYEVPWTVLSNTNLHLYLCLEVPNVFYDIAIKAEKQCQETPLKNYQKR